MAQITIEMVDEVMERLPYVSYRDAKDALLESDGDVLEAVIILEKSKTFNFDGLKDGIKKENINSIGDKFTEETERLREQIVELSKNATSVRLIVEKSDRTILNIPLGVGVLGVAAMPIPTLLGLSAAVIANFTVRIADDNSDAEVEFGAMTPEKIEILKDMMTNSLEEMKIILAKDNNDINENDSDITDELINEKEVKNDSDYIILDNNKTESNKEEQ
ncbi:hypothetical protein UF10_04890 [Peptostreptococcus russellii]|uniref:DUF4342 domain-containing protein n=1 Tax=Peptostreptococcus russellii TaxID=215200 RepID=A0A2P7Q1V3_9FIRM|nr:DUF4342 domain-containing protein [Peptostreptococcus russellii]PSJ31939.1 hypothetical protein UF10_04890 [Peptostreptococcus russellii]